MKYTTQAGCERVRLILNNNIYIINFRLCPYYPDVLNHIFFITLLPLLFCCQYNLNFFTKPPVNVSRYLISHTCIATDMTVRKKTRSFG